MRAGEKNVVVSDSIVAYISSRREGEITLLVAAWKVSRFFNPVSRRKGYEYSPANVTKEGWQKGLLARAKRRRRWLSAPERRVTFSIRHEQSFALLPCSIYLPFFWRTSPRVRALNSTPPVNSPDGRLPGISQILLFTILPDVRCMPRATTVVRKLGIGEVHKFIRTGFPSPK